MVLNFSILGKYFVCIYKYIHIWIHKMRLFLARHRYIQNIYKKQKCIYKYIQFFYILKKTQFASICRLFRHRLADELVQNVSISGDIFLSCLIMENGAILGTFDTIRGDSREMKR